MKHYELTPIYDSRKSFYKKAYVTEYTPEHSILRSYNTEVAAIKNGRFIRLWSDYSDTTQRHINEYRQQAGLDPISKKEWLNLPIEGKKPGTLTPDESLKIMLARRTA